MGLPSKWGQATALATLAIDQLPTKPGLHANPESKIANPLDPTDTTGIVHCHDERFRLLERVLGRFCTESGSVALHPSEDHFSPDAGNAVFLFLRCDFPVGIIEHHRISPKQAFLRTDEGSIV